MNPTPHSSSNITLFHDGCSICEGISALIDAVFASQGRTVESVDLSVLKERAQEAKALGIRRLPSLVIDGRVLRLEDHSPLDHYL